jgi:hypothetical protein
MALWPSLELDHWAERQIKAVGWGKCQGTGLLRRIHCDSTVVDKTGGNGRVETESWPLEMTIFRSAANMHLLEKRRLIWELLSDGSWRCS